MRIVIAMRLFRDRYLNHTFRSAWRRAGELA